MTVDVERLRVFAELADGAGPDTDLDGACRAAAAGVGADGVVVSLALADSLPVQIGGAGPVTGGLVDAELSAAEGPAVEAAATGRSVLAADLADPGETRWPILAQLVDRVPVRAVVALPVPVGSAAFGSVEVCSVRAHGLDEVAVGDLGLIASGMTRIVRWWRVPGLAFRGGAVAGLPEAEIHQAVGSVSHRLGVDAGEALARLRAAAFVRGQWLSELARNVTAGRWPVELSD